MKKRPSLAQRIKELGDRPKQEPFLPSKDWQIGYLIGELIFSSAHDSMPTHTMSGVKSGHCIKVSPEDEAEHERLSEATSVKYRELEDLYRDPAGHTQVPVGVAKEQDIWKEYIAFRRHLEHKYLPNPWRWHLPCSFRIEWNEEFRKGLGNSLWNSDGCPYNIESARYITEDLYPFINHSWIEFKLDSLP